LQHADFRLSLRPMKILSRGIIWLVLLWGMVLTNGCDSNQPAEKDLYVELPEINTALFADFDSAVVAKKALELDRKFLRLKKLTGFNGAVLYAEKGRVIFKKAYGYANVRYRRDSLTTHSAFQLASVSKMFSAMAVMILKTEGKIDYDEDIRTYLPEFPYENVTCRLLMTHRSGLPRYMSLALDHWKNKRIPMDNNDMMELFVEYKPDVYFKPNHGFHYCNTNYALLANVVEAVTGKHFDEFVEEKIFKPLGMNDSFVYNMRGDSSVPLYVEKGVPGYYHRGWRWRRMENDYLNGVLGDKNVYTSVEDLYKYDRALDNFTLVPDTVLREAFKKGSPKYWRRKDNYGFGWRLKSSMDSVAYHFGWWKGFRTFYIRDMRHQKMLVVLTNKDRGPGSANFWNIIKADTLPIGRSCDIGMRH
jgi:CubicO group peptidase (beta-lactamase class C family)